MHIVCSFVFKTHALVCRSQQSCTRPVAEESACGAISTSDLVSQKYRACEPQEPRHGTTRHECSEAPGHPGTEEGRGPV